MILSALVAVALAAPAQTPPARWTCDAALFGDGACDCGCKAPDSDCDDLNFAACDNDHCADGEAPWEHQNDQCMASTCGDGWKADNEACDDKNALASGGCSADCTAVNDGFTCGVGAEGCTAIPDAGEGEGEGEREGEGEDDDASGGCAGTPAPLGLALAGLLLRRRRRL